MIKGDSLAFKPLKHRFWNNVANPSDAIIDKPYSVTHASSQITVIPEILINWNEELHDLRGIPDYNVEDKVVYSLYPSEIFAFSHSHSTHCPKSFHREQESSEPVIHEFKLNELFT